MSEAVRVAEGRVTVEVRAPGHRTDRREVTIAAGETVRLVVQLAPLEGARAAAEEATVEVRPVGPTRVVLRDAPPGAVGRVGGGSVCDWADQHCPHFD